MCLNADPGVAIDMANATGIFGYVINGGIGLLLLKEAIFLTHYRKYWYRYSDR